MKNNLIVDVEDRLVRYLSGTNAGSIHDKRICDEESYTFPPGCVLFKDTGFHGYAPENICTHQPKKKPRRQELTPAEKAENTMISHIRILVEHVIGSVKRCYIVQGVFRGFDHGVGHPLLILCPAKAPNYSKNKALKGLAHYSKWPTR